MTDFQVMIIVIDITAIVLSLVALNINARIKR